MKTNLTKLLCTLVLLGAAATANAQLSWNWAYNGYWNDGSGTLTTTADLGGYYQITGITGTYGEYGISQFDIDSLQTSSSSDGLPDNHLLAGGVLDSAGLGFFIMGQGWVRIYQDSQSSQQFTDSIGDDNLRSDIGSFTATPATSSVPEPSQIISLLALSGIGGLGALVKLRRRK
jgi:hypothetical protein